MMEQKRRTNRINAQASTGPKTVAGRKRSAQNARSHGLSLPVLSDPVLSIEVEQLAQQLVGRDANKDVVEAARRFAAAQIDLVRIQRVRFNVIAQAYSDPHYVSPSTLRGYAVVVRSMER